MQDNEATVFSNQAGISARVCPRGHVYVQLGHTCLSLRKEDFLALAQVVQAVEDHLQNVSPSYHNETRH